MWHEARRSEKRVHEMMDAAKKRAERRAYQRARRAGDPTQLLRVAGSKLRLLHHSAVYQSAHLSGLSDEESLESFRVNWKAVQEQAGQCDVACHVAGLVEAVRLLALLLVTGHRVHKSPAPAAAAAAAAARPHGIDYSKWDDMDCTVAVMTKRGYRRGRETEEGVVEQEEAPIISLEKLGERRLWCRSRLRAILAAVDASTDARACRDAGAHAPAVAVAPDPAGASPAGACCWRCSSCWAAYRRAVSFAASLVLVARSSHFVTDSVEESHRIEKGLGCVQHVLSGGLEKAHAEEKGRGGAVGAVGRRGAADYMAEKDEQRREHLKGREWERYVDGMAWILQHGGGEGRGFRCSHCSEDGSSSSNIAVGTSGWTDGSSSGKVNG
ncbi:unnamed protein product [Closterium sp. NIES-64]|nr:unnamed protein product [Closterium sp. NIES-64]